MVSGSAPGDMAVVYWEGDDPRGLIRVRLLGRPLRRVAQGVGREVSRCDPSQTLKADDEEVFEVEVGHGAIMLAHRAGAEQPWLVGRRRSRYRIMCSSCEKRHDTIAVLAKHG